MKPIKLQYYSYLMHQRLPSLGRSASDLLLNGMTQMVVSLRFFLDIAIPFVL